MKRSYVLAFLIAAAAVAWVLSGVYPDLLANLSDPQSAAAVETKPDPAATAAPLTSVRIAQSQARERSQQVVIYGRTESTRNVQIKAETPGRIVNLPVERGARVKAGDLIAELAMDDRVARLREAKALVRQRQIEFNAAEKLKAKGYRAETSHAASMASLDAARAKAARMQVEISKTRIKAPFDGVIEEQAAKLGAFLKVGEVVATLVDEDPILVVGQISENDVDRVEAGSMARARLVTGEEVEGRIRFIAATADSKTRTFRIELEVANPELRIRDGLTAELLLPLGRVLAHVVSPAVLSLDDDGRIGVRGIEEGDRVRFFPVQIIGDDADGVWLIGLPAVVDIIVVGQEYVRHGDRVKTVNAGVRPAS